MVIAAFPNLVLVACGTFTTVPADSKMARDIFCMCRIVLVQTKDDFKLNVRCCSSCSIQSVLAGV